jgi:hypothetical protein
MTWWGERSTMAARSTLTSQRITRDPRDGLCR